MRILFIAPYVPSRIRIRPFQIIKGLSQRHEVHVLALGGSDKQDTEGVDEMMEVSSSFRVIPHSKLQGYLQSLVALPSLHPMCTAFCWSNPMKRAVADAISSIRPDVIHVEHLRAAHFLPASSSIPVLFDSVDCLCGLFGQMAGRRKNPFAKMLMAEEWWKLRRYEPRVLKRFGAVIVTSVSEAQELRALDADLPITVVSNGVDTEYFTPMDIQRHLHRIVFSGKMSYQPNAQAVIWFAENVFSGIRRVVKDAEFVIVGSDPPTEVVRLASLAGVRVTGYVDDIRPHLASASVAVVPMQIAVGIQNKILEAMSMGLPVVVSPVASRALGNDCPGLLIADGAEDTLHCVLKLLEDADEARRLGELGQKTVRERFSWDTGIRTIEDIYSGLLTDRVGALATGEQHERNAR